MEAVNEPPHTRHTMVEPEDVGALRRAMRQRAQAAGIAESIINNADLVATELGTNLLRHALSGGYILLRTLANALGIELISVDRGPGILDVPRALAGRTREDYERAANAGVKLHGMGVGLASVKRLSSEFDVYSRPSTGTGTGAGFGTVVVSRLLAPQSAKSLKPALLRSAGISIAIDSSGCGDGWAVVNDPLNLTLLLVDGLGHGHKAALAADAAVAVLRNGYDGSMADYFERANHAMRATRGGGGSLCRVDPATLKLHFGGAGNIEGRVFLRERSYGLIPRPGTLGVSIVAPVVRVLESGWEPGATLILHSDGLRASFDPELCRRTRNHDPAVFAALLHRDCERGRDDATVVVVRDTRPEPVASPS